MTLTDEEFEDGKSKMTAFALSLAKGAMDQWVQDKMGMVPDIDMVVESFQVAYVAGFFAGVESSTLEEADEA